MIRIKKVSENNLLHLILLNEVNNQFKVDKTYVLNILLYAS